MIYLRQSTASQEIPLGYFVDSTDGNTEETALSIANTDIKVWKTGATTLANKNSGGATHISNGIYYCVMDATDTDTIGPLVVFCHVAGALTVRQEVTVLDEAVYDVMFGTTALATATNITAGTITTVTNLTNAPGAGDFTATMKTSIGTAVAASAVASVTGNVGGNVVGSVGSVASAITLPSIPASWITAAGISADAIGASELASDAVAEIAGAVWDIVLASHLTAGTVGAALNSASAAGDPWSTSIPGAYGAGSAGYIIGNNLNAAITTRLASASYTAPLDAAATRAAVGLAAANLDTQLAVIAAYIDTEVGAIKAKTDNLPADPADASDIATLFATVNATLATLSSYVDTEVAAIKAKTDQLVFTKANEVDVNIQSVNGYTVNGTGADGDEWGP